MEPSRNDVLFGRGQKIRKHNSETLWKTLVEENRIPYRRCDVIDKNKKEIAKKIVYEVHNLDPPGRFLDRRRDAWIEVDEEKAIDKTMQALRYDSKTIDKIVKEEKFQETLKERIMQQSLPIQMPTHVSTINSEIHPSATATNSVNLLSSLSSQDSTLLTSIDALQFAGTSFSEKTQGSPPPSNLKKRLKATLPGNTVYRVDSQRCNEEFDTRQNLGSHLESGDVEIGSKKCNDTYNNQISKGNNNSSQKMVERTLVSESKTIQQEEPLSIGGTELTKTLEANLGLLQKSIEVMQTENDTMKQKMFDMAAQMIELKQSNDFLMEESFQLHKTHEKLLADKELLAKKLQELQKTVEK